MQHWVELAGKLMEGAGVLVTVLGAPVAAYLAIGAWRQRGRDAAYRTLRQSLGRAILLGLEFMVAADIIRTVSRLPTLMDVAVLAAIVIIRTLLSFTLEVELEGRWPWQARRSGPGDARSDPPRSP